MNLYGVAIGLNAALPIVFGYNDILVAGKVQRCMAGVMRKVCDGELLTLSDDNVPCDGGNLYTVSALIWERIPAFASEVEYYKQMLQPVGITSSAWISRPR